mmetsp:Transcript_14914/g.25357  ORF Transcript_14914/g.25357 Transcript_14914/m.25357 type:complete len:100 (-) Transcript_14914:269-568(-)
MLRTDITPYGIYTEQSDEVQPPCRSRALNGQHRAPAMQLRPLEAEAVFAIPGLLADLLGQMPASPLQGWYCRRRGLQRMMRCQWSPERPNSLQRVPNSS